MALVLMVLSVTALALGLGDIHTRSALNQNFSADLELLSVDPAELDGVRVSLASPEAFERAGVDRPFFLSALKFAPMVNDDGNTIIRVTSGRPIREPFLDFLVEVRWAKGRLVREYTVLLDPPTTLKRRPPEVARPTAAAPAPVSAPVSVATAAATAAPDQYGPVKDSETLWGIASKLRLDGASLTQTMMALYKANPGAFLRGDINRLKRGSILRVPPRAEVMGLSRREADAAYRAEQDALTARSDRTEAVTEGQPAATAAPAMEAEPAKLHIATARPEGEGEAGAGEDDATAETAEDLENALLLAREETETARQESEYLRGRVEAMEEEVVLLRQRILNLKDEELAQMQAKLGEDAEMPAPEAEAAPEPEQAPATEQAPRAEPGLMAMLAGNAALVGGAAAVLVALIVLLLLLRRRGGEKAEQGEPEQLLEEESILTESRIPQGGAEGAAEAAPAGGDTSFLSEFSPSDINTLTDETSEVDPVSEADVYIAYGRYDQAEELLNQALSREPERMALKFKLLEVYYANHNAAAYAACAQELADAGQDGVDAEAWQRVCEMGRELNPDYPLFSAKADAAGAAAEPVAGEETGIYPLSDLDLDTELEVPSDEAAKQAAAQEGSGELSPETGPESVLQPGSGADEAGGETEMDLTLDLDDLSMPESVAKDESTLEDLESIELELPDLDRAPAGTQGAGQAQGETSAEELDPESLQAQLDELSDLTDLEDELSQLSAEIEGLDKPLSIDEVGEQADEAPAEAVEIPAPFQEQTAESDEAQTKLDLAIAFVEMGDKEGARSILEEVRSEGNDEQKAQAEKLLTDLDS
jgi:pilus assembly protein FimV